MKRNKRYEVSFKRSPQHDPMQWFNSVLIENDVVSVMYDDNYSSNLSMVQMQVGKQSTHYMDAMFLHEIIRKEHCRLRPPFPLKQVVAILNVFLNDILRGANTYKRSLTDETHNLEEGPDHNNSNESQEK